MPDNGRLYWKVCGMKDPVNIREVAALGPDFMGFIFYAPSPRYVGEALQPRDLKVLDSQTAKVGVFVDAPLDEIEKIAGRYDLDYIQLHGNESPDAVRKVAALGVGVIKVVSGNVSLDNDYMNAVEGDIDYWLLDYRSELPGGTGKTFNRSVLDTYSFRKPVILSGGLDAKEVSRICSERHPAVVGVDLNSKVEDQPGLKNIELVKEIKNSLLCNIR